MITESNVELYLVNTLQRICFLCRTEKATWQTTRTSEEDGQANKKPRYQGVLYLNQGTGQ